MLMDYYGPELYSKMTAEFDPDGVAALSKSLLLGRYSTTTTTLKTSKSDLFLAEKIRCGQKMVTMTFDIINLGPKIFMT